MANSVTARNALADAIAAGATWISVHTADPGTTGANEVVGAPYARKQTVWGTASGGDRIGSQVLVDVPTGGPYTHLGAWSAVSGGTFWSGNTLTPAETFAGAGILRITPTIDG